MKLRHHAAGLLLAAALALPSLNSCYFNSAGHIFAQGSRAEAVNTADLKPGYCVVYFDGLDYYVELPRYKTGKPIRTQYSITNHSRKELPPRPVKGETIMVRITHDFAMYLTGQAAGPSTSTYLEVVQDEKFDKTRCRVIPVTQAPGAYTRHYTYRSPYMLGWYGLGAFDWLCVDLPMTCLENSLMLVGGILYPPLFIPPTEPTEVPYTEQTPTPAPVFTPAPEPQRPRTTTPRRTNNTRRSNTTTSSTPEPESPPQDIPFTGSPINVR